MYIQVKVSQNMTSDLFNLDLDLDQMIMILKLDLNIVKMYLHTKNEVLKRITWTGRHTGR